MLKEITAGGSGDRPCSSEMCERRDEEKRKSEMRQEARRTPRAKPSTLQIHGLATCVPVPHARPLQRRYRCTVQRTVGSVDRGPRPIDGRSCAPVGLSKSLMR